MGEHPDAIIRQADKVSANGDPDGALALLWRALADHPNHDALVRALAERLIDAHRGGQAIAVLRETVARGHASRETRITLARALVEAGRYRDAQSALDAIAGPPDAQMLPLRVTIARNWNDLAPPVNEADNSEPMRYGDDQHIHLLTNLIEAGAVGEATQRIHAFRSAAPDHPRLPLMTARLALMWDNRTLARHYGTLALARDPERSVAAAQILFQAGDVAGVRTALGILQELQPGAESALPIARLQLQLGMAEAALETIEGQMKAAPQDRQALLAKAEILTGTRRLLDADALLARLLSEDQPNDECRVSLPLLELAARVAFALGRTQQALDLLRRAITASPAPHFHTQRALWMAAVGRFDDARNELAQIPQSAPPATQSMRLAARASIAAHQMAFDHCADLAAEALRLEPRSGFALDLLMRSHLARLDTVQGWETLARVSQSHRFSQILNDKPLGRLRPTFLGQFLNEYDLQPDATATAKELAATQPHGDADGLGKLLLDHPNHTGVAVAYMIALRRSGALDRGAGQNDTEAVIPGRLHQFWAPRDRPDALDDIIAASRACCPDWSHRLYGTAEARALVKTLPDEALAAAFRQAATPGQRADLFRLAVLVEFGGVFLNATDLLVQPIRTILPRGPTLILHQDTFGAVGTNIMAATPQHPVLKAALQEACEAVLAYAREVDWLATGPGLLTRCLARHLAERGGQADGIAVMANWQIARGMRMNLPLPKTPRPDPTVAGRPR
ncbi:MAG: tetratricopeptide repeat protein [Pseudomonadota bacterium]